MKLREPGARPRPETQRPPEGRAPLPVTTSAEGPREVDASALHRARALIGAAQEGLQSKPSDRVATPAPEAAEMMRSAKSIARLADLAVAYAQAGKHQLAARRLAEADEALAGLETSAAPRSPAQERAASYAGAARELVAAAGEQLAALRGVAPVGAGASERKRTVLLFGLSANPPTGMGGHAGIVSWGAKDLRVDVPNDESPEAAREDVPIDEVWVLPVYRHAFSEKRDLLPFEHRFEMARLAFESLPGLEGRVQVKDTERQVIEAAFADAAARGLPPEKVRVGTIDLVRKLIADHADTQFVLALGGDTFRDLKGGKWKEGDLLQRLIPIVVIPRAGVDGVTGADPDAPKLSDISSTKVRGTRDLGVLSDALHPDVLRYIQAHQLYAFGARDAQDQERKP